MLDNSTAPEKSPTMSRKRLSASEKQALIRYSSLIDKAAHYEPLAPELQSQLNQLAQAIGRDPQADIAKRKENGLV